LAVRGNVAPVAYTGSGIRLSDGSTLDADAIIWCTGFSDKDVRTTLWEVLGGAMAKGDDGCEGETGEGHRFLLGPKDIASRLDATWAFDAEGEIRGMWKRHLRMENYWVMGGVISQQRWWSRSVAQQIRLALDGCLPPAYRDTPTVVEKR
jgi:hypothetical protein